MLEDVAGGGSGSPGRRAEIEVENEEEEEAWRASKVQAARVTAATEACGADLEWWEFRTGDPLLDRHITLVDLPGELEWDKAEPGGCRFGMGAGDG